MAVAAATTLPSMLNAGVPTVAVGVGDSRCPSRRYRKLLFPLVTPRKQYELIGQGAQKKVYRAFDEERGIEVAWNEVAVAELARFREKDQQRVFAEIRVLKQLKHKNIMTLHDYWFDQRRLMLVFITEIFPDGTLRQYRRRHKHADLPAIKRWAWQILQGLVYLHGHNPPIIHRDLKCDNIFVCGSSGTVKIGDLGLVTLCRDFTAPQSVLGTPEFMAPELYEEKYDEKVDVYAFGMCLLELALMEYPYAECKNAAQIYKKVTQGIPPASVERLASAELREFVMLCLCHDPKRRPEARQLLKHSFFEAIRSSPPHTGGFGTPPKLTVVSSISVSPSTSSLRPVTLTTVSSATAAALVAAATAAESSPLELSRAGSGSPSQGPSRGTSSSGAVEVGAVAGAAGLSSGAQSGMWSISAAAGPATPAPACPLLSVRSTSIELPGVQPSLAAIAASISPQPTSPIAAAAAASGVQPLWYSDRSSAGGAAAALAPAPVACIAASLLPHVGGALAGSAGAAGVGLSQLGVCGLGSIASSLSPVAQSGASLNAAVVSGVTLSGSAGSPPLISTATGSADGTSPGPHHHMNGGVMACPGSPSSPASAVTAALQASPQQVCATTPPRPGVPMKFPGVHPVEPNGFMAGGSEAATLARCGAAENGGTGYGARVSDGRSGGPCAGISPSAAAIAAAAVSAAAAAVGASSGPPLTSPLGLPSIHDDHELHEEMLFDNDDSVRRGGVYRGGSTCDEESQDEDDVADDGCGLGTDTPAAPAGVGGGRSQPVNLQVRSSSQAAVSNMALSFAMSFTSQRGVRKKVGFQYDLLHDTASAIAVEMVENLSLNTAEAEAIAAMIQHEVSRFNARQQDQGEQQAPEQG